MKYFQVNTLGNPHVKLALAEACQKKFGQCNGFTQPDLCKAVDRDFLQFWEMDGPKDRATMTHNAALYQPEKFQLVSIETALKYLAAPESRTIRLNDEYTAVVSSNSNDVKVGCQSIPVEALREVLREFAKLRP